MLQEPDIGGELTDGCYGFATKYMHWHEDLIVGGIRKNKTGHIVRYIIYFYLIKHGFIQKLENFVKIIHAMKNKYWKLKKSIKNFKKRRNLKEYDE